MCFALVLYKQKVEFLPIIFKLDDLLVVVYMCVPRRGRRGESGRAAKRMAPSFFLPSPRRPDALTKKKNSAIQQPLPGMGMRHMLPRKKGMAELLKPGMLTCALNVENTVGSQKQAAPVGPDALISALICEQQLGIENDPPAVLQLGAMDVRPAPPPMLSTSFAQVAMSAPAACAGAAAARRRTRAARADRTKSLAIVLFGL